jgi:large subunit ribosomal protein L10
MNRQNKQTVIEEMNYSFAHNKAAFIVGVQGMTVGQIQDLRKMLRKHGGTFKVAKNTLVKRAIRELNGIDELKDLFKMQVGVVFVDEEFPAAAKDLYAMAQENDKCRLIAGCIESQCIDSSMIKFVATLPPRPVLLAQVCGTLQAPITATARVLNQLLVNLVYVLDQASKKAS